MTTNNFTDPFTEAARRDMDPGPTGQNNRAWFVAGAEWQAAQEPTDAEVLAALEAFDGFNVKTWGTAPMSPRTSLDQHAPLHVERMRAVLRDARATRRDEEKRAACGCDLTGPVPPAVHIVDRHEGER